MTKKKVALEVLEKVGMAFIFTLLFGCLSLLPYLGNKVDVQVNFPLEKHRIYVGQSENVFAVVRYNANASFNPLLYPLSWFIGRGSLSGNFSMIYLPYWVGGSSVNPGDRPPSPQWGKPDEIEGEAAMKIVIEELLNNVPILPAVFFVFELLERRRLYWWFFGGIMGFDVAALTGAIVGFSIAIISTMLVSRNVRRLFVRTKLDF